MRNKNKKTVLRCYGGVPRGFTLIEFMVACSLGLIVLLAIGVTYGTTVRMRRTAESRVAVQQDLRNASELILRDAQMAGSFGCFNMGNLKAKQQQSANGNAGQGYVVPRTNNKIRIHLDQLGFSGVTVLQPGTYANIVNGFNPTANSEAVVFAYGLDSTAVSNSGSETVGTVAPELLDAAGKSGPMALSSCSRLYIEEGDLFTSPSGNKVQIDTSGLATSATEDKPESMYLPQTTLSRVQIVLYAVGQGTNAPVQGLYRFTLQPNGRWGNPQLLAPNINLMKTQQIYSGCAENNSKPSFSTDYNKIKTDNRLPRFSVMPTTMDIRLSIPSKDETYGTFSEYVIRANVRGGNICANLS